MKKEPLVSIITVNYNQSVVTSQLLDTLENLTYNQYEIIVVDNGSTKDNPEWLKAKYPSINLIKSGQNLGFAGGNNVGIKASKGEYLLFINNDTEVPANFIEPMVQLMENNNSIGMVSPKIKFHWDPSIIQYAGFTKMSPITIRNQSIGYLQKDSATYNTTMETHSIHGAAMMVKKEVINKIGLMPQIYFLYYEEHDWAVKAKREGYKLYYCAQSHILHKESLSTGKDSPLKTYYLNRGRLIYTIRNSKRRDLLLSLLFQFFISLPKNSTIFIIKREFQNLKAYWRAYFWVIKNFKQLSV
ncbi:MAG: glycosyltransferase family 2 protein [Bacteroidales bacterium]|nr:glycosyltransferase family 2 protein [Bacteroidales bacterium]